MTKDYYVPEVKKTKDLSEVLDENNSCLAGFIDSDNGSIEVKLEKEVIRDRVAFNVYTSWLSGVRELLTNEIKACKIARDKHNAKPNIIVSIDPNERQITIQGFDSLGISSHIFGKIVAWLGRSHNFDRDSIGMFGMGIESYTTLSNTVKLESNCSVINNCQEVDDKGVPCPCRGKDDCNVGKHDNFIVIGRDGKDWQPLNAKTDIPYGTKITITLNEELDGKKVDNHLYKILIERVNEVVALHGIPTTIHLLDEIDDDDDMYAKGKRSLQLLDRSGYIKLQYIKNSAKERYGRDDVEWETAHTLEKNRDDYDIVLMYANSNRHSSDMNRTNTQMDFFTTLINVPIKNELSGSGIHDSIDDMVKMKGLLRSFPQFTALLINLKSESQFPPVASRDSLKEGWITKEMYQDMYDLACEWYEQHRINNLDELMELDHKEISTWHYLWEHSHDNVNEKDKDRQMLSDVLELPFQIYKANHKKFANINFFQIMTQNAHSYSDTIHYDRMFYMSNFYRDKIVAIEKELDSDCTFIRMNTRKRVDERDGKAFTYLMEHMGIGSNQYFHDVVSWLKNRKVKVKITRVPRPKGSIVWHYSSLSNSSYDETSVHSHNYYDKKRHDDYSMKNILKKKHIRLQLSQKLWGKHKLSIDNIRYLLESIPSDVMFCKSDTDMNAHSVDDYIKGVMNRKVYTNQGNMLVKDLLDSFRDDKKEVKLMYYPYPDIINEKTFKYDDHFLIVMGKNSDELIGLALCFMTDGYVNDKEWAITYDDKHTIKYSSYSDDCAEIPSALKKSLPKKVVELLTDKRFVSRWSSAEHRGCMLLALVDLHRTLPAKYFKDMARSLTYTNSFSELSDEVKRIKELFADG